MIEFRRLLLASHGTPGARAAERVALELCSATGTLFHLLVVPELWRGMMGDDWLNNASTRATYGRYLEGQLQREIDEHVARLRNTAAAMGVQYQTKIVIGDPVQCLVAYAQNVVPDLIVMGARRPKAAAGLRSRMHVEPLAARLPAPLLIVPLA